MSNRPLGPAPGPEPHRRAAAVGGWTVASRPGRVWLHARPGGDGDLTPDTAEGLAAALQAAAVEARRGPDRSWTRHPQGGCHDHPA